MGDHYYSSRPSSESKETQIKAQLLGHNLIFNTDNGVFSKNAIDFGSRFLIESAQIADGDAILDLGCAYGAVGIALARAFSSSLITLVEINERACALAQENAVRNDVGERITVYQGDGFSPLSDQRFDHILFNPPIRAGKVLIHDLFEGAKEYLKPNGVLWIVIRKQQGAESAVKKLRDIYNGVEIVKKKKGYWILRANK